MTKAELRKLFLQRRRDLSPADLSLQSEQMVSSLFREVDPSRIAVLHCFISMSQMGEVDTRQVFERLWNGSPGVRTCAPRVNRERDSIESIAVGRDTPLLENTWGIREPVGDELVPPAEHDVVVVPLLCFDARGYRVGYGKGYYDRFLAECRSDCLKIGLSFFPAVESIDDIHAGDVPLDICLTPDSVYRWLPRG